MTDSQNSQQAVVLIVDDSKMIRLSMNKILGAEFEVIEADDGEQGLEKLRADERIQVVLTDSSMPGLNGYELIECVRMDIDPRVSQVPIIMVTAAEDEGARDRALEVGATDFILKPFDKAELLARVRAHVQFDQTTRTLAETATALQEQSTHDQVTGLASRSYFIERGEQDLAFAKRHDNELTVVCLGIDGYDDLFEKYDESGCNQLLCDIAGKLKGNMRKEDTVARLEDGRFAIIAPTAGAAESYVICDRIRDQLAAAPVEMAGTAVQVTMSMGLVCLPDLELGGIEAYLETALGRMVAAQEQGGNHIFTDDEGVEHKPVAHAHKVVSLDAAVKVLKKGDRERLKPYVPRLLERIMPLLEYCLEVNDQALPEELQALVNQLSE